MKWRNSNTQYGWLPSALHWLMLLLLVAVFASMELRGYFPKGSVTRDALKSWHYTLGISVLLLALLRLAISFTGPVPAISPPPPLLQALAARLMKLALYGFMVGMPLMGWAMRSAEGVPVVFFGLTFPPLVGVNEQLAEWFEELHEAGASVGYVLIGLHSAAALYHHYFLRDDTLRRMLPK